MYVDKHYSRYWQKKKKRSSIYNFWSQLLTCFLRSDGHSRHRTASDSCRCIDCEPVVLVRVETGDQVASLPSSGSHAGQSTTARRQVVGDGVGDQDAVGNRGYDPRQQTRPGSNDSCFQVARSIVRDCPRNRMKKLIVTQYIMSCKHNHYLITLGWQSFAGTFFCDFGLKYTWCMH